MTLLARIFVVSLCLCSWSPAFATIVQFETTLIGGTTYQNDYTITNDTLGVDIEYFQIFFDYTLYENLILPAVASPDPAIWDPFAVEPIPGFALDGIFDVCAATNFFSCADNPGIAPGATLGLFSIQFDWLGVGAPGLQSFTIIDTTDPFLSAPLDQGTTVNANAPGIPEPSTPLLMLVALGVFYRQWKKLPD